MCTLQYSQAGREVMVYMHTAAQIARFNLYQHHTSCTFRCCGSTHVTRAPHTRPASVLDSSNPLGSTLDANNLEADEAKDRLRMVG